jgi:hypothetical protein
LRARLSLADRNRKHLLDQGIHTSWPTVRDTIKPHQVCTLPTDNGSILRIRKAATPEPEAQEIYHGLTIRMDPLR